MRFDRQVLYLVFLFGSAHAAPARTNSTTSPSSTASLDDSPSLGLDISPQLISSVADFASQLVSAAFAEESSSTLRSSTRHVLDDESSSSESYPPIALQTTGIATPSDPKNPAVTSSTSTQRRSRTRLSSTAGRTRTTAAPISGRPSTTRRRLQSSSQTAEDQATSPHHTTQPRPATTHALAAQAYHNSTRLNSTMNQESEHANMTGATNTADGIGGLLTAIGQVAALSGSYPASATGSGSATETGAPDPTNALDVLFSALPSSLAAPIQSQYSDIIDPVESGVNSFTSAILGSGQRTTHTRIPSTSPISASSTSLTSTSSSFTTTTTPTPLPPPTTTGDTMLTRPSNTDTAPDSATTTDAPSAAHPSENAAVAGIATGVASGVVLILLAGVYLWRRRQQGKAPFNRSGSNRSNRVYPEVAWLYDPDITPPRSRAGSGSGAHLIPEPRPGSVEIGGTPVMGGASPEMRPARPSSPLLAPVLRGSRDMVGSRSRSGSEVDIDRLRPLSTLREETPRGSMS